MECKSCGQRLKANEKICTYCGYYNDDDDDEPKVKEEKTEEIEEIVDVDEKIVPEKNEEVVEDKYIDEDEMIPPEEKPIITDFEDDRLIEAFIGEDYRIINKPFNIYALIFSWIYFIYRKMYITGIIGLLITGIVVRFFPIALAVYVPLVMILSGFLFNIVYKKFIIFKINSYRNKDLGMDNFTLEQLCKKKGGVSTPIALLIMFMFFSLMILSYYSFSFNFDSKKYWDENSENKANCRQNVNSYYDLLISNKVITGAEEALCSIKINNNTKKYNIYFKVKTDNNYEYLYLNDNNDSIVIDGQQKYINALLEKEKDSGLTDEERKSLDKSMSIENEYKKLYDKSIEEDELIKKKKNKSEKLNYIFDIKTEKK